MESIRHSPRGRYEILEEIGQGSMGVVYRAREARTGRLVALKALNDGGTSLDDRDLDRMRRLFLNEAGAGTLLTHSGIVTIYDLVDEPGSGEIFLVMELVEGQSLEEVLSRPEPIPFDYVVDVISKVADVLDHVHAHGVVHRDVKPANILLGSGSTVKVSDFGIADLYGSDLSDELRRDGSPSYMAPERVLGTGGDYRSDIWALGVVLYQLLTRRLPFEGESVAEVVRAIACDEPTPSAEHGVNLMPGLQPILDKALAKEPQERYQYAGEMADDLEQVQQGQLSLSATLPALSIPDLGDLDAAIAAPKEAPPKAESSAGGAFGLVRRAGEVFGSLRSRAAPILAAARLHWRLLAVVTGALAMLAVVGGLAVEDTPQAPPAEAAPSAPSERQLQRLEYLALLEEARQLLEAGETAAAASLFAQAEALSPDARRIRTLRDDARRQAAAEVAAELDLEVAGLVGLGEADLENGNLGDAEDAAQRALELTPEHPGATALADAVAEERRVRRQRAQQQVVAAPPVEVVVAVPEPEPEPEPEPLRIEQPIEPPEAPPATRFAHLKVDFYSELPRGVVTVYREETQILRRPFRFVQKKGFMRSKGVSGGFDEQIKVDAGAGSFRVYLSLPGEATRVERLSGIVPAGTIRALQVRVSAKGEMTIALH
jgi:hypothetical protein